MAYVSSVEQKSQNSQPPVSAKKQFERLIRDIRMIAANSRTFTGEMTKDLVNQFEDSSDKQKKWSNIGALIQFSVPLLAAFVAVDKRQDVPFWMEVGNKVGNLGSTWASGPQLDHQVNGQRIGQAQGQLQAFDQRIQSFMQSIDQALQTLRQQEIENARM